jgi:hypothetical protein
LWSLQLSRIWCMLLLAPRTIPARILVCNPSFFH